MEQRTFDYSLKNIPIPSEKLYKKRLIEKVEDITKWMRWKAHFFEQEERSNDKHEKFGFKVKDMENFECDLIDRNDTKHQIQEN